MTLPPTKKVGKRVLRLLVDTHTRKPYIGTIQQIARAREHFESQGYVTSAHNIERGGGRFALYMSAQPVPRSERPINISHMHGKMEGVESISTNPAMNPGCQKFVKCKGSVCERCYSYKNMVEGKTGNFPQATSRPALTRNTRLLTNRPIQNIPKTSAKFFRFSAEGDIHNEQHLLNFFQIAQANPHTHFTLWTKQVGIVQSVLARHKKPRNLHLIRSSFMLNKQDALPHGFDKVFTVYTPEYIEKHHIRINCGAKSCMSCQHCYTNNSIRFVNEKLKPGSRMVGRRP